ncbi:MAG: HAD hydrolase family protein [Flavobacteriales bacterium]|nr:HAD hydrolase family protein [Flavobacteriales bacterium]
MTKNYKEKLKDIQTLIFDVDGVFTDNTLYLIEGQQPMRKMNVKDGYALQLAVKSGYRIAVITGGRSEAVRERFLGLGVQDVFMGSQNKLAVFDQYISEHELDPTHILYMGDDIPDRSVMKIVGLACCPQDATDAVKEVSDYISYRKGGEGCVRDILEQLLRLHGHWLGPNSKEW